MIGALHDRSNPDRPVVLGVEFRNGDLVGEISVNLTVDYAKVYVEELQDAIDRAEHRQRKAAGT